MGTLIVCTVVQVAAPGDACQTVSVARCTASAVTAPPGPGASVTVPGGSAGSGCHWLPALVMVSPRRPVRMTAAVPPGPNDAEVRAAPRSGSGGESAQWPPLPADQAVSRLAAGPVPAASSAAVCFAVWVSLRTVMSCRARAPGRTGPAACQVPFASAKMPAVPGRAQAPPTRGIPDGVKEAAVRSAARSAARLAWRPGPAGW